MIPYRFRSADINSLKKVNPFKNILPLERKLLLALVCLQLVFLIQSRTGGNHFTNDSYEYLSQASNLLRDGISYSGNLSEAVNPALYTHRPPGYALFLIVTGSGHQASVITLFAQVVLVLAGILFGLRAIHILSPDSAAGRLYLVSFFFFPSLFIYAGMYMAESLLFFLWASAFYFIVAYECTMRKGALWFAAILISLSLLVKPVSLVIALAFTAYLLVGLRRNRERAASLAPLILPILVWMAIVGWNRERTGVVEYSSVSRRLLLNYTLPELAERRGEAESYERSLDSLAMLSQTMTYQARVDAEEVFIKRRLTEDPANFLVLELKGLVRFMTDPGRWDMECWRNGYESAMHPVSLRVAWQNGGMRGLMHAWFAAGWVAGMYLILVWMAAFVSTVWFLRFVRSKYGSPALRVFLTITVLGVALVTGPSASARFRVPVWPLIAIAVSLTATAYGHQRQNDLKKDRH